MKKKKIKNHKKVTAENPETRLAVDFSSAPQINTELEWRLYKVADIIDAENFRLCDDFAVYPIKFNVNSELGMKSLAYTLSAYTGTGKIYPKYVKMAKPEGTLKFNSIEEGWYLVKAEQTIDGDMRVYSSAPILVCVADGNKYGTDWKKDTTVFPKLGLARNATENNEMMCAAKVVWEDDCEKASGVTIELYQDGRLFDSKLLGEENEWYCCWKNLSSEYDWTIKEENLPVNYYVNYDWNINDTADIKTKYFRIVNTFEANFQPAVTTTTFLGYLVAPVELVVTETTTATTTITGGVADAEIIIDDGGKNNESGNKQKEKSEEKLPQTGMNILPIPILAVSGILLILIGWRISAKSEE